MANINEIKARLSAIGDAIREKRGETELYRLSVMPEKIRGISSGNTEWNKSSSIVIRNGIYTSGDSVVTESRNDRTRINPELMYVGYGGYLFVTLISDDYWYSVNGYVINGSSEDISFTGYYPNDGHPYDSNRLRGTKLITATSWTHCTIVFGKNDASDFTEDDIQALNNALTIEVKYGTQEEPVDVGYIVVSNGFTSSGTSAKVDTGRADRNHLRPELVYVGYDGTVTITLSDNNFYFGMSGWDVPDSIEDERFSDTFPTNGRVVDAGWKQGTYTIQATGWTHFAINFKCSDNGNFTEERTQALQDALTINVEHYEELSVRNTIH